MVDEETGAMGGEPRRPSVNAREPGLVLSYAPTAKDMPSVVILEEGTCVLGRDPPPGGVTLPLTSVSRVHVRVHRKADRVSVHDLGSRNGVFVRGERVDAAELRPGDDLRIGDAAFIFVADGARAFVGSRFDGVGETPFAHAPIACGPASRRVFEELVPIARSEIPVLVLGETGTGKELVAEAIHSASRRSGALRALNCAAIAPTLVESELFGFKKGAFTGAERDNPGIVKAAHGGTLFLDEVGDLPPEVQPKLLRLLESHEVAPVGAARTEIVDVRVVCATHADMEALVRSKRFRADLYARIRGHVVHLPPLRARKEDMVRLVTALLRRIGRAEAELSVAFMMALLRHDWPFNVRELFSVLRRAVALAPPGTVLDVAHLPDELLVPAASEGAKVTPATTDGEDKPPIPSPDELREALRRSGGNVAELARIFRRDRSLIHRWLKLHDIDPSSYRTE